MFIPIEDPEPLQRTSAALKAVTATTGDESRVIRARDAVEDYLPPGFVWNPELTGEAIRAFMSKTCPFCDEAIPFKGDPFCQDCLQKLPPVLLNAISDRLQFLESYHAAIYELQQHSADTTFSASEKTPQS